MKVFVDSSAIVALIDSNDIAHEQARLTWLWMLQTKATAVTTNYVVVETLAVVQRKYGLATARLLADEFLPALSMEFVGGTTHERAQSAFLTGAGNHSPSMVDCASFEVIRELGIDAVLAYDRHFEARGYTMATPG